jgi:putative ABC transport system permease protein
MNILRLVLKNIFCKKGRFIFTLLGISIGMASFVALLSMGGSMRGEVTRQAQAMGANIMIMPDEICIFNQIAIVTGETISELLQYSVFEKISVIEGITVIPHLIHRAAVRDSPVVIGGILPEETRAFRGWVLAEGEYFVSRDDNAVVVGSDFARRNALSVGDDVTIRGESLSIIGILSMTQSNDDGMLFLPLSVAQRIFQREGYISFMSANVDDMAKIDSYIASIVDIANVHVSTDAQLLDHILAILGSVNVTLQLIAGIALIAAAFGIINTMMTAVYERRREIGIMQAIGGKNGVIFKIFVLESGLYGLLGGITGVIIGLLATVFAGEFISQIGANDLLKGMEPAVNFNISLILASIAFSFVISVLSGLYPAWKASRLTPVEAISYE